MKKLNVIVANLGWKTLERRRSTRFCGLEFAPRPSVFPAVTCVAQATLRTGLAPQEHGMLCNGTWIEGLNRPMFWEQSSRLVKGRRVWGKSTGLFFLQQSFGEDVEMILSPAPIHKHGGGMAMACYTKPSEMAKMLERRFGSFPLWRYWGPLASPKIGRRCIDFFEAMTDEHDIDEAYLYLPTLDYAAQKHGPDSRQDMAAFAELRGQIERLARLCDRRGCELSVAGDYEITPVSAEPARPNVTLRECGLFAVREVGGMTYPDFHLSHAFAVCDHELCMLVGDEKEKARDILLATGAYEESPVRDILLARRGSWCEYKWWRLRAEAPDYAAHVDIHNKPGFDPTELFFFGRGVVKGTHGRQCAVAASI